MRKNAAANSRRWGRTLKGRYWHLRHSAKKRGLKMLISLAEHGQFLSRVCRYCDGPLSKRGHSLDRLDNSLGYEMTNVVECCGECNRIRSNVFTYDEMVKIGQVLKEIRHRRAA